MISRISESTITKIGKNYFKTRKMLYMGFEIIFLSFQDFQYVDFVKRDDHSKHPTFRTQVDNNNKNYFLPSG